MRPLGRAVVVMGKEQKKGDVEFDPEVDWEPVKLLECWSNVVVRIKTKDEPCGGILGALQWSES